MVVFFRIRHWHSHPITSHSTGKHSFVNLRISGYHLFVQLHTFLFQSHINHCFICLYFFRHKSDIRKYQCLSFFHLNRIIPIPITYHSRIRTFNNNTAPHQRYSIGSRSNSSFYRNNSSIHTFHRKHCN